jgi:hypothetical protein
LVQPHEVYLNAAYNPEIFDRFPAGLDAISGVQKPVRPPDLRRADGWHMLPQPARGTRFRNRRISEAP